MKQSTTYAVWQVNECAAQNHNLRDQNEDEIKISTLITAYVMP